MRVAKNRKHRWFFGMLAGMLAMLTVFSPLMGTVSAKAAEDLILKVHYDRPDGKYDGWDVWLWEVGKDGAGFAFVEEDGEMVATKVVTPGTMSVGYIVRTQDWTKDINADQFVDLSEMVSGTVHIYIVSGVEGCTKVYGEDAVIGVKISAAKYNEESNQIAVTLTGELTGEYEKAFSLIGPSGEIEVSSVTADGMKRFLITPAQPLSLTREYAICFDGTEYRIHMPNIYSTEKFEDAYTYTGNDLGAVWSREKTTFRVWAPTADSVTVNLYAGGTSGTDDLLEQLVMKPDVNGTWVAEEFSDLNGTYYTYLVTVGGKTSEVCDPYARTTGVNGRRAMVIDLASTNPEGWENDTDPHAGNTINDAIIYELHVRDVSMNDDSGITAKGKFLGLTETGTKNEAGNATGLDYIKELGITHLHLLPVYDFGSVDETRLSIAQFNWGYDPVNYNVPEGSYSTDPTDGFVRVREMKQMVQTLHQNGISVVMDVVYNHVYNAGEFCFNRIVPGYFSRIDENGVYSNGSGCGNDTATERSMVRKYIADSVKYWADEYHIDGFRFDLVGLIDIDTMKEVIAEVHKDHPNVIFYGEGWTMNTTLTKEGILLTTQANSSLIPEFAFFSDTIRDALKGNVFDSDQTGYVSGAKALESVIEKCFMGLAPGWCTSPSQSVNYASCHDNLTLHDRIRVSLPEESEENIIKMCNLAASVYMLSEGIPFFQAGEEILRTKVKGDGSFDGNSYASSDYVNSIKWSVLADEKYQKNLEYYKGLIAFRKEHAALRMTLADDTRNNIHVAEGLDHNVTAFTINGNREGEPAESLFVVFNPNKEATVVTLPEGKWHLCINGETAGVKSLKTVKGKVKVEPISAMVLVQGEVPAAEGMTFGSSWWIFAVIGAIGGAVGALISIKRRKTGTKNS